MQSGLLYFQKTLKTKDLRVGSSPLAPGTSFH